MRRVVFASSGSASPLSSLALLVRGSSQVGRHRFFHGFWTQVTESLAAELPADNAHLAVARRLLALWPLQVRLPCEHLKTRPKPD
jgi:hypothetical protein